jgi:hypothetical protein
MTTCVRIASVLTLLLSCARVATAQDADLNGPHRVGYSVLDTVDATRSFPNRNGSMGARPMRLYLWYPAVPTARNRAITLADLFAEGRHMNDPARVIRMFFGNAGDTAALYQRADSLVRTPLLARMNAPVARGRFPVVLLAPGPTSAVARTAEILASHGHVVIGSAGADHTTFESLTNTPNDLNTVAASEDLEFALAVARGLPYADAARVGALGFSSSSLPVLAFAFRTRVPRAVVTIEGWESRGIGADAALRSAHFEPAAFKAAYLAIEQTNDWPGDHFRRSTALFDSLRHVPRWRVTFDSAGHGDFLWVETQLPRATAVTHRTFAMSHRYLVEFMNAQLDVTPRSFVIQESAGINVRQFAAEGPRFSIGEFYHLAETQPARARSVVQELKAAGKPLPFSEASLLRLANLKSAQHPAAALDLVEAVLLGYPGSARGTQMRETLRARVNAQQ